MRLIRRKANVVPILPPPLPLPAAPEPPLIPLTEEQRKALVEPTVLPTPAGCAASEPTELGDTDANRIIPFDKYHPSADDSYPRPFCVTGSERSWPLI